MQCLALLGESVGRVHDGSFELALRVARGVLSTPSAGLNSQPLKDSTLTRMFGVSDLSETTSLARSAVVAKLRAATEEQPAERTAALNGARAASLRAIVRVRGVVKLRGQLFVGGREW